MKLYTLHISHRHGDNISVHASHDEAIEALADYSREWWAKEGLAGEPPADDQEVIRQYWDHVEDESANIEPCEIALPIESVVRNALAYEGASFDGPEEDDLSVSGADLVDWFSQWRLEARAALEAAGVDARPIPEARYPYSAWQDEVDAGDTKRGYADWVAAKVEEESH